MRICCGNSWWRRCMARRALLKQCSSTRCLSCSIVAEDPHLIFSLVNPTQFRLCSYVMNMGATACGGKADSISMPHSSSNMKVWGGALSLRNPKINWGLRNKTCADGLSVGSGYSHNFPDLWFQESPAYEKITFSSLLFVLEFMVRNITAFYSGCWYIATLSVLPLPVEQ